VESRILTNAGEEVVRPIFANGEGAWRFALDHPAGSTVQISALGHGDELESDGRKLLSGFATVFTGAIVLIFAMAILSKGDKFLTRCGLLGVWAVFLIGGLSAASTLWPNAVRHVRANWWQSVPCEVFAERKVSSGKHGTAPQFAIRYAFLDGAYETVSGKAPFFWQLHTPKPAVIRVNPAAPWQTATSWGFHPGLLSLVCFPLPFLTVGIGGVTSMFCPSIRRLLEGSTRSPSTGQRIIQGVAAVGFFGGFVGLFAGFICEIVGSLIA
jgi:hypothetical protein